MGKNITQQNGVRDWVLKQNNKYIKRLSIIL